MEACLWAWTPAVVMAIYSTRDLVRALARVLRDRDLLGVSFDFTPMTYWKEAREV